MLVPRTLPGCDHSFEEKGEGYYRDVQEGEWRLLMRRLAICPVLRTASLYIVQGLSLLSGRSGMEALPNVPKRSART